MKQFPVTFVYCVVIIIICKVQAQAPQTTPQFVCPPEISKLIPKNLPVPFPTCSADKLKSLTAVNPDTNLNTDQILKKYKYPFQTYNVTTKDKYKLKVYRITGSPNSSGKQKGKKQAVYVQHGLAAASDTWLIQPGNRNLAFKLADAGYEVWLGNSRGTTYSPGHETLDSKTNPAYWNFSWHEMGIYDLPAVTDTILKESQNKKIFYIGHSMGTTMFFVALSEIPDMNKKFIAGFMLAPIAYIGQSYSPLRPAGLTVCTDAQYQIVNVPLQGKIESTNQYKSQFKLSAGEACELTATQCGACDNLLFLLFGYDAPQMNNSALPVLYSRFPNSMSLKTLAHYAQSMTFCTFKKYDYGPLVNPTKYKSLIAPEYKLQNIKVPMYFMYGENDNLGVPKDVNKTAKKFSKGVVKSVYKIKHDLFNHVDFQIAKDADKLVYDHVLKQMNKLKSS